MAEQRNQGQFFKSLYRADTTPIVGEDVSKLKVQNRASHSNTKRVATGTGRGTGP